MMEQAEMLRMVNLKISVGIRATDPTAWNVPGLPGQTEAKFFRVDFWGQCEYKWSKGF
jgi:hypothetical protein